VDCSLQQKKEIGLLRSRGRKGCVAADSHAARGKLPTLKRVFRAQLQYSKNLSNATGSAEQACNRHIVESLLLFNALE
jgi:hypothetical protein